MTTQTSSIYRDALVWDSHSCLPLTPGRDLSSIARHRDAGVSAVSINVGMDAQSTDDVNSTLAHMHHWFGQHGEEYALLPDTASLPGLKQQGKMAIYFDLEGANALGEDPAMVERYYQRGVRQMLLAYNRDNAYCGGCLDGNTGLSPLGRQVIQRMQQTGMLVDCSHISERSARDIMDIVSGPMVFSHANPNAVYAHPRNISDGLIRACANSGGVVCINGIGIFLGDNDSSTQTLFRHLDYVCQMVGAEHLGFGLDFIFDGEDELEAMAAANPGMFPNAPHGDDFAMVLPEQISQLTQLMQQAGYPEAAIRGILGENYLRVVNQVWK